MGGAVAGHGGTGRRRPGTVEVDVPAAALTEIPWPVWRVATSGRFGDSLHTILNEWTLAQVYAANQVIDALSVAEERASKER